MKLSQKLDLLIEKYHLLKHPFYVDWTRGALKKEDLVHYAEQYWPHVEAFPRFVSALHSQSQTAEAQAILLENLLDEEGKNGGKPHPELWIDFARGMGSQSITQTSYGSAAQNMADLFHQQCQSSYAGGLATLYVYESQVPEIAEQKIAGLKCFYQTDDAKTLAFFSTHLEADKYHRESVRHLLDQISDEEHDHCLSEAEKASQSLWNFLSEVHRPQKSCECQ